MNNGWDPFDVSCFWKTLPRGLDRILRITARDKITVSVKVLKFKNAGQSLMVQYKKKSFLIYAVKLI